MRRAGKVARASPQPAAVVGRPEERGEERVRVEAREAEPVDRSVLADEREAAEVSDDGVVFDAGRHTIKLSSRLLVRMRGLAVLFPLTLASASLDGRCK